MQYYLLAPFVFRFFSEVSLFALFKLTACIVLVYLISRHGFFRHFEYLYCFLLGYAVNVVIRMRPINLSERAKILIILIGIVFIDVAFNWLFLQGFFDFAGILVAILSAAMVFFAECPSTHESSLTSLCWTDDRAMAFTGAHSYGIYVWHYMVIVTRYPLFTAIADRLSVHLGWAALWQRILLYHFVELGFTLVVTYLLATITFYLVEVGFVQASMAFRSNRQHLLLPVQEPAS